MQPEAASSAPALDMQYSNCLATYIEDQAALKTIPEETLRMEPNSNTRFSIEVVLRVMEADLQSELVQEAGCKVLFRMAQQSFECCDELIALGAVPRLLAAIEAHPLSLSLQHVGLSVLCGFATSGRVTEEVAVGTVHTALEVMRRHGDSAEIQGICCQLLQSLAAAKSKYQAMVASVGSVEAALCAMETHPEVPEVQEMSCRLLRELAAYNEANQVKVASLGGIQLVLQAMDRQLHIAALQEVACGVLRNMAAGNADYQKEIASFGGVHVVTKAMSMHQVSGRVQWAGTWTLFCLAVHNTEIRAAITNAGGIELVLVAMSSHPMLVDVQEAGCWALKELVATGTTARTKARVLGAVSIVKHAMKSYTEVAKVQVAGRGALRSLTSGIDGSSVSSRGRCGLKLATPSNRLTQQPLGVTHSLPTLWE